MEYLDTDDANWEQIAQLPVTRDEILSVWTWQVEDDLGGPESDLVEFHLRDSDDRILLTANYRRNQRMLRRQQSDSTSRVYDYQLVLNEESFLLRHPQKADFGRVAVEHHFLTRQNSRGLWALSKSANTRVALALYEQLGFQQTGGIGLRSNEIYFAMPRTPRPPLHGHPA